MTNAEKIFVVLLVVVVGLAFESRITGTTFQLDALHPTALADAIRGAWQRWQAYQPLQKPTDATGAPLVITPDPKPFVPGLAGLTDYQLAQIMLGLATPSNPGPPYPPSPVTVPGH